MKNVTLGLAVVVLAATAAIGCGKNKMVEAAENYEKAACACKDAACATAESKKFAEESQKLKSSPPTSGSDAEAYVKATTNAAACVTKVSMANIPGMPAGMPAGLPAVK